MSAWPAVCSAPACVLMSAEWSRRGGALGGSGSGGGSSGGACWGASSAGCALRNCAGCPRSQVQRVASASGALERAQGATPGAQAGAPKPLGDESQIVQLAAARGCATGQGLPPGRTKDARAARSPTHGWFWGLARSASDGPRAGWATGGAPAVFCSRLLAVLCVRPTATGRLPAPAALAEQ